MGKTDTVINHYQSATLTRDILACCGTDTPDAALLSKHDEFHLGGSGATAYLADRMGLRAGMRVVDAGCGVGGAARYIAGHYDVRVTGIDLTPDFVRTAQELSQIVELTERTEFIEGSVTDMPFDDGIFDAGYTIHVGMNVADKATFYREMRRVLRKGAVFAVYDICGDQAQMNFPLPWASIAEGSALTPAATVKVHLQQAGFDIFHEENRTSHVIESSRRLQEILEQGGMQDMQRMAHRKDYLPKISNLLAGMDGGICAPWLFLCRV